MKVLVINVAALGFDFWSKNRSCSFWDELNCQSIKTVFPALTSPVQASFRTALSPEQHGLTANGIFNRELQKIFFWEQSSTVYDGERIWEEFRSHHKVGQVCWQQSLGNDSDLILSPAPIHKHHGGMIQDFYSKPSNLYCDLCKKQNKKFNLFNYWGPFTSLKSTKWIAQATIDILQSPQAPELLLTYLPHLDYDLQRYGPQHNKALEAFNQIEKILSKLIKTAQAANYEILLFGDYAISEAKKVLFPNKILAQSELFNVRKVKKMLYPDIFSSQAFALVDHQIANIFIKEKDDINLISQIFQDIDGIDDIIVKNNDDHKNCSELTLVASDGCWFAYPWWDKKKEAPDYSSHVDIHNKPGFDPCELFTNGINPMSISQDTSKIKGTHGRNSSPKNDILCASSFIANDEVRTLLDLAKSIKKILN